LEAQTEQAEQIKQQTPEPPQGEEKQLMSSDGALVPLVGGVWAEVKKLALAEVTRDTDGDVCTQHPSYFSRLTDAETFQQWALVETQSDAGWKAPDR
jgi:hypothetical protein